MGEKGYLFTRNLRFWGKYALKKQCMLLGITAVYAVFTMAIAGAFGKEILSMICNYIIMIETVGILVCQVEYVVCNLPLIISFGACRKESVWGIQIANVVFFISALLVFFVSAAVLRASGEQGVILHMGTGEIMFRFVGVLMFVAALGQTAVVLCVRNGGKKGAAFILFIVFAVIVVAVMGVLFYWGAFGSGSGSVPSGVEKISVLSAKLAGPVGIAGYAASLFALNKYILTYEVR